MNHNYQYWFIIPIVIIATTSIIILYGYIILNAIKNYNKKSIELKNTLEELKLKQEKLILETEIEIQEETFQYISKEIHDNIIQILSLAKVYVHKIENENFFERKLFIEESSSAISQSIQDLNNLSKSLDSDLIENHGLTNAISYEINKWQKHVKPVINFKFNKTPQKQNSKKDLILFRIFQESMNNSLKYSNASDILITLNYNEKNILLNIEDNGKGFNTDEILNAKIIGKMSGLKNIRKRAESLNGELEILSSPNKGTKIYVNIPQ